jgi:large subunit ribosomal protein L23
MNAHIIKRPVITEKALTLVATQNVFTFEVMRTASKRQVQDLVESLYQVKVVSVNTVVGHVSTKSTGRKRIKRVQPKTKKAFVKLQAGQKIALFDMTGAATT